MSTPATDQGHFQPVHSAHSIEQVMFVLQFHRPLKPENFASVKSLTEQFRTELPGGGPIQSMAFAIGGPTPQFSVPPPQLPITGHVLNRTAPDGSLESELRVELGSMSFRTTRYSRWATIWGSAHRYFGTFLNAYFSGGAQLASVSLNFVDKFVWHGEIDNCDASKLLRNSCDYVTPQIFNRRDLWHSHTGAFERFDQQTKRLININFDCLDEISGIHPRRVISMTTVWTDMFGQPGFEPVTLINSDALEFLSVHMASLHALNKEILSNSIVESMAQKIALNG